MDKRTSITDLKAMTAHGEKIVMITAYDYPSAHLVEEAGVPLILVGDSLGNVVLDYDSTIPVTIDEMLPSRQACRPCHRKTHVVADMPFMCYQTSPADALHNAGRMHKEGGAQKAGAYAIVLETVPVHVG
jgi:3-methyl-2-oxobutanoate hydroxymethyltransferase